MPTFQNIVLADATTPTPVNHTLTPQNNEAGVALVAEASSTKVGETRLSITPKFKRGGGKKFLTDVLFTVPVTATETINGISVPKVVRNAVISATFSFDEMSTEQERKDCIAMFRSALDPSKPLLMTTLTKVEGIYG